MTADPQTALTSTGRPKRLMSCMCLSLAMLLASCGGGSGTTYGGSGSGSTSETPTTVVPVASDLLVTLSSNSLADTGSDAITVTVTAVDSSRVALSAVPVAISADSNAVVVAQSKTTNTNGILTATIRTGTDRSNRIVNVTATSGTITRSASFAVIGAKISASVLQAVIAPGAAGQIQYQLTDVNSNPMAGLPIDVSASGLTPAAGTTDTNGAYTLNYTAPTTPGNLVITATSGGVSSVQTIIVQSAGSTAVPAVDPATIRSASVSANPSVVSVNSLSSNNRTEIRALFLGINNAPIPNVRVRFDLDGDANSIGGSLSSANNVVISDANGIATTAYVPGTRGSPTNGVTVRACYYGIDADANAAVPVCASTNAATTQLTVVSEPLAVSIGTDATVADGAGGLTYIKRYVVTVVDASGQAKSGVKVTPSVDILSYAKGYYFKGDIWNFTVPFDFLGVAETKTGYRSRECVNEDVNRNGSRETGEDINKNLQLDPRKSDIAISMVGADTTDASGVAILQIQYAKDKGTWLSFRILVSASGISGTEGRATYTSVLPVSNSDATGVTAPAWAVSPYGAGLASDALLPRILPELLPHLPDSVEGTPPECLRSN